MDQNYLLHTHTHAHAHTHTCRIMCKINGYLCRAVYAVGLYRQATLYDVYIEYIRLNYLGAYENELHICGVHKAS